MITDTAKKFYKRFRTLSLFGKLFKFKKLKRAYKSYMCSVFLIAKKRLPGIQNDLQV